MVFEVLVDFILGILDLEILFQVLRYCDNFFLNEKTDEVTTGPQNDRLLIAISFIQLH